MLDLLFGKEEVLSFERTYSAPIDAVWHALTTPGAVRGWWGPEQTAVTECEIDVCIGGRIRVVMQAMEAMGTYAGDPLADRGHLHRGRAPTPAQLRGTVVAGGQAGGHHDPACQRRHDHRQRDRVRLQVAPRQARHPPRTLTARTHTERTMQDFPDVDAYIDAMDQWPDEITKLRGVLLASGLDETIKWGKPCCGLGDANVVIIQEFSDRLGLMFFKGVLLDDPAGVLQDQGPNSHAAKRMTFRSVEDIELRADVVTAYVAEAIAHEQAGTALPSRPQEELADELQERLAGDPELAAAFDELTPGRQREYILHVSGAKQASTRHRRVDDIIPRILGGKGLRDR